MPGDETFVITTPLLFGGVLVFMLLMMSASWLVAKVARNAGWIDVFWSYGMGLSGAAVALAPVADDTSVLPLRRWIVAALVLLWALRLGTYIALRVRRSAEDVRYRELRRKWGARFSTRLWTLILPQAPVAAIFCIAPYFAARAARFEIGLQDILGVLVWLIAVGGETLADRQMAAFKRDPRNLGKINDQGLWAWSRHPNYFFEWIGWFAYPIIAIAPDDPITLTTLIAPVLMYAILRYGTGVPPLERSMAASRGKAFEDYRARTSTFLLLPPRREILPQKTGAKSAAKKNPSTPPKPKPQQRPR